MPVVALAVLGYVGWQWMKTHPQTAAAAATSPASTAPASAAPMIPVPKPPAPQTMIDPRSGAANSYGMSLWADQHQGNGWGYLQIARADQITWNSQALHNLGLI